ncbi:MAG: hypothetical protein OEW75_11915, partial [Cyclobacteriaceae bacterium]|nr:hypothetical protein [Cyclobacteriaceae bacterium]
PFKSIMPTTAVNKVKVILPGAEISPDLVFKTGAGTVVPYENNGETDEYGRAVLELTLTSSMEKVLAYDSIHFPATETTEETTKQMCTGELAVRSYIPKTRHVVLVPVNGASLPSGTGESDLQTTLNEIYAPGNVNWTVTLLDKEKSLTVGGIEAGMTDSDDKILTKFTGDMNLVIDAFEGHYDPQDDTYYMFLINKSALTTKEGYMPFSQRYGFITVGGSVTKEKFIHTTAHELGHGAFNLRHPFSDKARYPLPENSTYNIMDYKGGTELFSYQWDMVDDPRFMLTWFMNEDEAAAELKLFIAEGDGKAFALDIPNVEKDYAFFTASLKPIFIQEASSIYFDEEGRILYFFVGDKKYSSVYTNYRTTFHFYVDDKFYREELVFNKENPSFPNDVYTHQIPDDKKYRNYRFAKKGDKVATFKDFTRLGVNCYKFANWENTTNYGGELKGVTKSIKLPEVYESQDFEQCGILDIAEQNGIEEGLGFDYYVLFYDGCTNDTERQELKDYCNALTYEANEISGDIKFRMTERFATALRNEGINTLSKFKQNYYSGFVGGAFVSSKYDFWKYLDEENYNRETGYEYSYFDLKVRARILSSEELSPIGLAILNLEEEGKAAEISSKDFIDKYGNASSLVAFIHFMELEAELLDIGAAEVVIKRLTSTFKRTPTKAFSSFDNLDFKRFEREIKAKEIADKIAENFTDPNVKDLFLETFGKDFYQIQKFVDSKNLFSIFEAASKHTKLRGNSLALSKLDVITTRGRGIDLNKLKDAISGDLGDVLNQAGDADLIKIINRLDEAHVTGSHLDEITKRLGNAEYNIKDELLIYPERFTTFESVLREPGRYWDLLNGGNLPSGSYIRNWGQGKWWKDLREKARNFERYDPNIPSSGKARESFLSHNNLTNNNVVDQVTLEIDGINIRIDYLGKGDDGLFHFGDAKFSTNDKNWLSEWLDAATPNQKTVFPGMKGKDVKIKASDPDKLNDIFEAFGIKSSQFNNGAFTIPANQVGSLKIFGSAADDITTVKKVVQIF